MALVGVLPPSWRKRVEDSRALSLASRSVGALIGWLLMLHRLVPAQIEMAGMIALLFLLVDAVTGSVVAMASGTVSSAAARRKTLAKLAQYFGIVSLGGGASLLMGVWGFYGAAIGAVVAIEALSIIENLVRLESVGVKLGPARPLLSRLSRFFDVFPGASLDTADASGRTDGSAAPVTSTGSTIDRANTPEHDNREGS